MQGLRKSNKATLYDDVRRFLDDPETPLATAYEVDKGHGRIETREAVLRMDWPGCLTSAPLGQIEVFA
jgi:hypothetical protein